MTTPEFNKAVDIVITLEGGYSNAATDAGGETKYGIAKRFYPHLDIPALAIEQAREIYDTDYWRPAKCQELPWPLCLFVFDAAVNQGLGAAGRMLQKAAGVAQDGLLGKQTLKAVLNADQRELGAMFMAERALRYTGTRGFDVNGRGWLKRLILVAMEGGRDV